MIPFENGIFSLILSLWTCVQTPHLPTGGTTPFISTLAHTKCNHNANAIYTIITMIIIITNNASQNKIAKCKGLNKYNLKFMFEHVLIIRTISIHHLIN